MLDGFDLWFGYVCSFAVQMMGLECTRGDFIAGSNVGGAPISLGVCLSGFSLSTLSTERRQLDNPTILEVEPEAEERVHMYKETQTYLEHLDHDARMTQL